jgi:hypothetical protein
MASSSRINREAEDKKRIERLALGSMENSAWKVGYNYKRWSPATEFADWRFIQRLKFEQRFNEFCRMVWEICQNYHGIEKIAEKYRISEDQDYAHRHRAAAYFIALHFYPPYYCYKNGVFNVSKLERYEFVGPPPVLPDCLKPMRPDLPFNWPFDSEEISIFQGDLDAHLDPNVPFTIASKENIPGYQPKPAVFVDPLAGLELAVEPEPVIEPDPEVPVVPDSEPEADIVLDVPASEPEPAAEPVIEPEPEAEPEEDEDDFDIEDATPMDLSAAIDWAWANLGRKKLKRKDCPSGGAWYVWNLSEQTPAKFFEIANRLHERREKEQVEITKRQADDRRRSFEFLDIVRNSFEASIAAQVDGLLGDSSREEFFKALSSRGFAIMRTGGAG